MYPKCAQSLGCAHTGILFVYFSINFLYNIYALRKERQKNARKLFLYQ